MKKSNNLIDYFTVIGLDSKNIDFVPQKGASSQNQQSTLFLDKIEIISCIVPEDKTKFNKPEDKWF